MLDADERLYERFQLIVNGPALFNAITTGIELDVFGFLSRRPASTLEEVTQFIDLDQHRTRILMFALCTTELIDRIGGRYSNSRLAEDFLAQDEPDSWRHILLGWQRIYYPAFAHMTEALRAGTNTALRVHPGPGDSLYERLGSHPELEQILHRSMAAFTQRSMSGLLDNADLSSARHLLDIGGGNGATAYALAARFPHLRVTIFDLPTVASLADNALPADVAGRVTIQGGNFFADEFPKGADVVLFSHVLEVFRAEEIRQLIAKAYEALPIGGRIFLYGFNAAEDETRGVLGARLSLYLNVLATGQGMAYPAKDYEDWLERAGFTGAHTIGGLPCEHGLTMGTKA